MARDPSKTEKATPKQRNRVRKKGNVPKSQEVSKTLTVIGGLLGLYVYISYMAGEFQVMFRHFLTRFMDFNTDKQGVYDLFVWTVAFLAKMTLPILLFIGILVFVAVRRQVGKLWTTEVFKFKFSNFNIINGIKRMFASPQTLIRLAKSILQAIVIGIAPWLVFRSEFDNFIGLYHSDARQLAVFMLSTGFKMTLYALIPMTVIAVADLIYTRWSYEENIKMSKQDVKEEQKQMLGDPVIKGKQRQKMMETIGKRMLQSVQKADVVITNPTHIAVALMYDAAQAPAPFVVAMGVDHLAEKIKEEARKHNVPIRENVLLARALYKSVKVGDVIPEELYKAVATLLAGLSNFRSKLKKK